MIYGYINSPFCELNPNPAAVNETIDYVLKNPKNKSLRDSQLKYRRLCWLDLRICETSRQSPPFCSKSLRNRIFANGRVRPIADNFGDQRTFEMIHTTGFMKTLRIQMIAATTRFDGCS